MKPPEWVLPEAILALHERLLCEFGGLSGLRDSGLFESSLAGPRQLFTYGKPDLFAMAASYAAGLVRNHQFVDGNIRIGLTTAILFLELNGFYFNATEVDATLQTLALAASELPEEAYARWLKSNCVPSGK